MNSNLRKHIRHYTLNLLSLMSKPKPGVHILNGHFLSLNNSTSNIVFKILLEKLIKIGINLINIQDACDKIINKSFSIKNCEVAFTFDDGFEECFTKIAPVLDSYNLKAAFFVNPGFIDGNENYRQNFLKNIVCINSPKNPMSWNQLIKLKNNNHIIGAHTLDHQRLQAAPEAETQIVKCKELIQEKTNGTCDYFAFPYGRLEDFDELSLQIASKYYKFIFSQSDYRNYFSFQGKVINRRHFECDWPHRHVLYFLKSKSI
ncbi:MAG: hypothetical protein A2275_17990 [Bacteroidetes bacterium RIFOXYA12_FULL_35_11]|nr:MAG: hypothetical protein A2275_17990 [Bacteroidetes bacterium RIFOXYA12_FULL_35_11]